MKKRAVVLNSGGLDSTTCIAIAKDQGFECYTLSFDYGQCHIAEVAASRRIAAFFNVPQHIISLSLGDLGGSALTDQKIDVPNYSDCEEIPVTYVPARNTVFLSLALSYAEVLNAEAIFTGICATDHAGYPDTRPEFAKAFQAVINTATKETVTGGSITLHTPLMHLTKAETIKLGTALGADYSLSVTCYRANDSGLACGHCDSCVLRQKGFQAAGIIDPTRYVG